MNAQAPRQKLRIHILGGGKGMGFWLATKLFHEKCEVVVIDVNARALEDVPEGVVRVNIETDGEPRVLAKRIPPGSVLLIATPMQSFPDVARDWVQNLNLGTLVVQCASVQTEGENHIRPVVPMGCHYLGMHPLFGANVSSPAGQIIALIGFNAAIPIHKQFHDLIESHQTFITLTNASEHDAAMLFVQSLTHFVLLSFAKTLAKEDRRFESLSSFRTPPFRFLTAFAGRLLKISPGTVMGIQAGELVGNLRRRFLEHAHQLHEDIESHRASPGELMKVFEEVRVGYSGSEVDEAATTSSLAVDGIERFDTLLYRYRESGEVFCFRHRDNGRVVLARIERIDPDEIVLNENIVKPPGSERVAIPYNEPARKNYEKQGIRFPKRPPIRVKKRKITLLSQSELNKWRMDNTLWIPMTNVFQNTAGFRSMDIENLLPKFIPGVISCKFLDSYQRRDQTVPSVRLALEVVPWQALDLTATEIRHLLDGRQI